MTPIRRPVHIHRQHDLGAHERIPVFRQGDDICRALHHWPELGPQVFAQAEPDAPYAFCHARLYWTYGGRPKQARPRLQPRVRIQLIFSWDILSYTAKLVFVGLNSESCRRPLKRRPPLRRQPVGREIRPPVW